MSPFVRPRPVDDPALRLIGFHHAGGSAAVYYPMIREFPEDWDLVLLDLPGRGKRHREPPISDMGELVGRVVQDVTPWIGAPFALFGHSLGAILAAEVGRELDARGTPPVWVGVSGRAAPLFQRNVRRRLHELDDETLLKELLSLGGIPERVHEVPEFIARFLRIARADLQAAESYTPHPQRPPLTCPVTAFGGDGDTWAPQEMVAAWSQETRGGFQQRRFPGGHFYFLGHSFAEFTRQVVSEARGTAERAAA
jgi:surfactin synthase thioesterase subunit